MNTAIREARFSVGELEQLEAVLMPVWVGGKETVSGYDFSRCGGIFQGKWISPAAAGESGGDSPASGVSKMPSQSQLFSETGAGMRPVQP